MYTNRFNNQYNYDRFRQKQIKRQRDIPQYHQYYRTNISDRNNAQKYQTNIQYYQSNHKRKITANSNTKSDNKSYGKKRSQSKDSYKNNFQNIMGEFNSRKQIYLKKHQVSQNAKSPIYNSPQFIFKMKLKMIQMAQTIRLSRGDIIKMYDLTPQNLLDFFMQKIRQQLTYFAKHTNYFKHQQEKFYQKSVQKYQQLQKSDSQIKNKLYRQNHSLRKQLRQKQNALKILSNKLVQRTLDARHNGAIIQIDDIQIQTAVNQYQMIIRNLQERVRVLSKYIDDHQERYTKQKQKILMQKNNNQFKQTNQKQRSNILQKDQKTINRNEESIRRELQVQFNLKLKAQIQKYQRMCFQKDQFILQLQDNLRKNKEQMKFQIQNLSKLQNLNQSSLPIETNPFIKIQTQAINQRVQTEFYQNNKIIGIDKSLESSIHSKHKQIQKDKKQIVIKQNNRQINPSQNLKVKVQQKNLYGNQDEKLFTEVNFSFSPNKKQLMNQHSSLLNDSCKKDDQNYQKIMKQNKRLSEQNKKLNQQLKEWKNQFLKKVQALRQHQNLSGIKQSSKEKLSFKQSNQGSNNSQKMIRLSKQWKQKLNQVSAQYQAQISSLKNQISLKDIQNDNLKQQYSVLTQKVKMQRQKQKINSSFKNQKKKYNQKNEDSKTKLTQKSLEIIDYQNQQIIQKQYVFNINEIKQQQPIKKQQSMD